MRRRFRRPLRRMFAPAVPPLLRRSNELLASGQFAEAATSLEQLARAAEARGGPRAPVLYIQAGQAEVLAGQPAQGLEFFERGLGLLAARGKMQKLSIVSRRVLGELEQRGLHNEASRLTGYLKSLAPEFDASVDGHTRTARTPLPTHCPGCGAAIRPDEVEWMDEITAECEFCGSPVRGD
jgi:hypothetical protein